jgi:photosystem II stability/assembly factor-like uncharacterized protein
MNMSTKNGPCIIAILITNLILNLSVLFSQNNNSQWESIGPNGGQLGNLAQAPSNSNILYITSLMPPSKIFKSEDNGNSWSFICQYYDRLDCIAVDPNNASVLYAFGNDILKSVNGGKSWMAHIEPAKGDIKDIAIHPDNSEIIHACGDTYDTNGKTVFGHLKSINSGETWTMQYPTRTTSRAYSMTIDPNDPNTLYIAGNTYNGFPWENVKAAIFRSVDGGESWTDVSPGSERRVHDIIINPDSSNCLYFTDGTEMYKSINRGDDWTLLSDSLLYCNILAIDPINTNIMYASGRGAVYKSINGGISWTEQTNGIFQDAFGFGLRVDNSNSDNLFLASDKGFFKSTNSGADWLYSSNGINCIEVNVLKIAHSESATAYVVNEEVELFKSTNITEKVSPIVWERLYPWEPYKNVVDMAVDTDDPNILYALQGYNSFIGTNSDCFKSTDAGESWTTIDNTIRAGICLETDINGTIYQGGYANDGTNNYAAVFKSTNKGETWFRYRLKNNCEIHTIAVHPENTNIVFAGGATSAGDACLFRSSNGGSTWEEIYTFISGEINSICIDLYDTENVLIGTSQSIFTSNDNGFTFTKYSANMDVRSIIADPLWENRFFAGTADGVFQTSDGGSAWHEMNDGLFCSDVSYMDFDTINNDLYIGTNSSGAFRYNLTTTDIEKIQTTTLPASVTLSQNYPNPFNPSTMIAYNLPKSSNVTLKIYNLAGQELETLVNDFQTAGEHQITWQPKGLPSGIYFYRLQTGHEFSETRKLIFQK